MPAGWRTSVRQSALFSATSNDRKPAHESTNWPSVRCKSDTADSTGRAASDYTAQAHTSRQLKMAHRRVFPLV
jgi:hypothetical protein